MARGTVANNLNEARILFRRKKYSQVISLLSPQIFLYRNDANYYELLGFSCLYTGDFGGAYSHFQRSLNIDKERIHSMLGLALVMIRRRKITDALRIWLEVLDLDPTNRQAKRALEIAKTSDEDQWLTLIEEGRYGSILPTRKSMAVPRIIAAVVVTAVVVAMIFTGYIIFRDVRQNLPQRIGSELIDFQEEDFTSGDYSQVSYIIFTEDELQHEITRMQDAFRRYRDNLVRYHGNRILLSNASLDIKDRVSLLIQQLKIPDFTDFSDPFSYREVEADPLMYNGVFVMWKGRVANLAVGEDAMQFEFLVGFETGRTLEGRVPVTLDFASDIQPGSSIELIGRIVSTEGEIKLVGRYVRIIHTAD